MFARGEVTLAYLTKRRPFLAIEVVRQGIEATVADLFKMPSWFRGKGMHTFSARLRPSSNFRNPSSLRLSPPNQCYLVPVKHGAS